MQKRIIGREKAVEALASVCRDYRGAALRAIRSGGEHVYIPANPSNPESMLEALANPEEMLQLTSQSNNSKEPCYSSFAEFMSGKNADGTYHKGYLLVDVVAKLVLDLIDLAGRSVVPEVRPLRPETLANELAGRPTSYCL